MHLQMVGVPIAPGRVVPDEDFGLLLIQDGGDLLRYFEAVQVGEALGVFTPEPRIRIIQRHDPVHPQRISGCGQLGLPTKSEPIGHLRSAESGFTIGRYDQHYPVACSHGFGHGAGGEQGFIVWVRVHEHQGVRRVGRHDGPIVPYGPRVRIAHVSDCYLPRTGGIESQVRALAGAQALAGDQVRVITATPGSHGVPTRSQLLDGALIDGVHVHRVAMRLPFELPIHLRTKAHVSELLTAHAVDVVHVHAGVISPFAWGAIRATHELAIPTLITVHSIWGPLARPAFRAAYQAGRLSLWRMQVSAVSSTAANLIADALPGLGEVLVVPNGIDPDQWQVARHPRGDALNVVTVMRLAPRKRTIALLKVMALARQSDRRINLTVVGDGPVRSRAEKFARDHGLAGFVRFTGRLDAAEIQKVFASSDVFVQPSIKESFGLAALEARSAGLPVVARSGTGTTDFITDGEGGLIAPDDAGLAAALVRLAGDRDLLEALTARNTSTPPTQTWPVVLEQVQAAYLATIARSGT